MPKITRRRFVSGAIAGAGVVMLAPLVPGCGRRRVAGPALPDEQATPAGLAALFGVGPEEAGRILSRALASGGDFAELYLEHMVKDSLKLEEGRVNEAYADISMGAGVRVVSGDQAGYAYTESLTEASLLAAAATAGMIARAGGAYARPPFAAIEVPQRYPVEWMPVDYPLDGKMELLRRVDAAARAVSPLAQVVIALHQNERKRVMIYRSDGRIAVDDRPRTALLCMVTLARDGRTERNYFEEGGRRDQAFFTASDRPEAIAREAVRRAEISFEAVVPPAGEMPVVLAPGDSGILLHEAIGHGLEADFNRKGASIYAGRIGQKVASELCTVIDDGTIESSQGSIRIDDEGEPAGRNVLIENGLLRGYLHDRISAAHYRVAPGGNGRRESYRHPPVPRMTNTVMLAGPHGPDEVFEGVKRGIYAIAFTNGQVNIGPGDYTFFVNYGYLIEDGKPTAPIKDVNIIGNGPESLARVDRVAGDAGLPDSGMGYCGKAGQMVPVNYGVPHLRISSVTVGGRQGGE